MQKVHSVHSADWRCCCSCLPINDQILSVHLLLLTKTWCLNCPKCKSTWQVQHLSRAVTLLLLSVCPLLTVNEKEPSSAVGLHYIHLNQRAESVKSKCQTLMSSVSGRLCRAAIWPWLSFSFRVLSSSSASLDSASEMAASFCSSMKISVASCFSASTFIRVENLTFTQVEVCWRVTWW